MVQLRKPCYCSPSPFLVAFWEMSPLYKAWNIVTPVLLGGSNKWYVGSGHGCHGFSQAWLGSISANLVPFHCLDNAAFGMTWSLTVFFLIRIPHTLTPSNNPLVSVSELCSVLPLPWLRLHLPLPEKSEPGEQPAFPFDLHSFSASFPGSSDIFFFLWLSSLHVWLLSRHLQPFSDLRLGIFNEDL